MLPSFRWFCGVALVAMLLIVGCDGGAPKFKNIDLTGAEYAKGFSLTDHNGKARTLADFQGKVVVIFFGFTRCPDVCPTTMVELKEALRKLGPDAERVQVLFVTLDPDRDTPEVLAQYVPSFDPRFLGLYGDNATTQRTAKDFKIFSEKRPGASPDNYTIDHSAASYVFDPTGRLRLYVKPDKTGSIVDDIRTLLKEQPQK